MPAFAMQQAPNTSGAAQPPTSAAKPVIEDDGTYHVGNGVTAPKLVYSVDAEFSDAAQRKKIDAPVVIGLKVGTDGIPREIHVIHSAAEGVKPKLRKAAASLDEKALDAVRQYRFDPATYHGKPVPVAITIDVSFHIYPDK
ncbi:MAG TPA: energy transducer TonB [Acidobacteriaceae bacterium]|nr:energy transducer TonB [Acidobacteriaceae bacterium]